MTLLMLSTMVILSKTKHKLQLMSQVLLRIVILLQQLQLLLQQTFRSIHHVRFTGIGGSTRLNFRNSRGNNYLVTAVNSSSNTITIQELNGGNLGTISTYTSGGSCQRLQASAHINMEGSQHNIF